MPSAPSSGSRPRSGRACAAGCTPGLFPLAVAAGIVLDRASPPAGAARSRPPVYAVGLHAAVRRQRASTTAATGARARGGPAAARPRQHLPDHRRHLHAVRRAAARRRGGGRCCWPGVGRRAGRHRLPRLLVGAPRWLYTPVYLALGWVAVFYLPAVPATPAASRSSCWSSTGGAALQRRRASSTALKRPNPSPRWFGFHEVFHALTIAAFTVQYVAVVDGRLRRALTLPGPGRPRPARPRVIASRSWASQSSECWPTRRTAQASACERDRATPASTRVSRTCRSGWRSRVITGTASRVKIWTSSPTRTPQRDLALEPVLGLPGDLDAMPAGLLAERPDPAVLSRGALGVAGSVGHVGRRERADDGDLLAVDGHLDRTP